MNKAKETGFHHAPSGLRRLPIMNRQKNRIFASGDGGFSLVEVCIALAVVAFSFITLIGLLGAGVSTDQKASQQTTATNIMTSIVADLRSTPCYDYSSSYSSSNGFTVGKTPHYDIALPTAPTTSEPASTSAPPLSNPAETSYLYFDDNQNNVTGQNPQSTPAGTPPAGAVYSAAVFLSPIVAVGPSLPYPGSSGSGSSSGSGPSYQLVQSTIMARVVVSWPAQAAVPAGSVETVTEFRLH
jgi:type II secretory pathway pseudopilin PulG